MIAAQPRYVGMRSVARFRIVRYVVTKGRELFYRKKTRTTLTYYEKLIPDSYFSKVNLSSFTNDLNANGIAFGLALPKTIVTEIKNWATQELCYAFRNPLYGFHASKRNAAEAALGKPILLAQYFNTAKNCEAINQLLKDPAILWIATKYLGSPPTFVGANLWWTFPVPASDEDRSKHAHLYHKDVDDFKFFKFFFYLTDVPAEEGSHVCIVGSHTAPPRINASDFWRLRRYSDTEIHNEYQQHQITEICGPAGLGFAENTLCVHKGSTPKTKPRLLLQLQFALFDYRVMHDEIKPEQLHQVV